MGLCHWIIIMHQQSVIITFILQMAHRQRQTHLFGHNPNRTIHRIRLNCQVIIKDHSIHHHIVHLWGKSPTVLMLDTLIQHIVKWKGHRNDMIQQQQLQQDKYTKHKIVCHILFFANSGTSKCLEYFNSNILLSNSLHISCDSF